MLIQDRTHRGVRYRRRMPTDMSFKRMTNDPDCPQCKCVDKRDALDTVTVFVRRIWDLDLCDGDFLSYWESLKRPKPAPGDPSYCVRVCSCKGVSTRRYTTNEEMVSHFRKTLSIRPGSAAPRYHCKLRFLNGAGKIRQSGKDSQHHDFFKSDDFKAAEHVQIIEVVAIPAKTVGQ